MYCRFLRVRIREIYRRYKVKRKVLDVGTSSLCVTYGSVTAEVKTSQILTTRWLAMGCVNIVEHL